MRYGKITIMAVLAGSLTGCTWIPPTDEQPPNLPPPNLQPLQQDAPDAQNVLDSNYENSDSPDDGAPVVVPPALKKSGST